MIQGPIDIMKDDFGNTMAPYLDKAGLHFPTANFFGGRNMIYDQYIPREILYQLIDEYFMDKEGK